MPLLAQWPAADASLIDVKAEKAEDLLERTLKDVQEIVSVTKATPTKITLYTCPCLEERDAAPRGSGGLKAASWTWER